MPRSRICTLALLTLLAACDEPFRPDSTATTAPMTPDAGTLFGSVSIQQLQGSADVMVFVDGGARSGEEDGTADHLFILQRKEWSQLIASARLKGARVDFTSDALVIRASVPSYTGAFLLEAPQAPALSRLAGAASGFQNSWAGYGLSRREGSWTLSGGLASEAAMAQALSCSRTTLPDGRLASFAITCDSGGTGSSECSASCSLGGNCSVKCTAGYYSCCDTGICSCKCLAVDNVPVGGS